MEALTDNWDLWFNGLWGTIKICLVSMVGALVLGTLVASARVSPVGSLRAFGTAYVTVLRNSPLTIVLFMIAFGLPEIGINGSYFWFGTGALSLYTAAFVCEALRGGINSVPPGQAEAARAMGLTFSQSLTGIVLPQAFQSSIPPLGSVIIAMFKNSAVLGVFGVAGELFSTQAGLTGSQGYAVTPVLLFMAAGYLIITLPSGALLAFYERKVAIAR